MGKAECIVFQAILQFIAWTNTRHLCTTKFHSCPMSFFLEVINNNNKKTFCTLHPSQKNSWLFGHSWLIVVNSGRGDIQQGYVGFFLPIPRLTPGQKVINLTCYSPGTLKRRRAQNPSAQTQPQRQRQQRENYQMGQMRRWGSLLIALVLPSAYSGKHFTPKSYLNQSMSPI